MDALAAGQVVVLPFPFSDLSRKKLRTALLLADAGRGDWIACQITSNPYADARAITLAESEFVEGSLQRVSYLRPGKLFTCHESLPVDTVGMLNKAALQHTSRVGELELVVPNGTIVECDLVLMTEWKTRLPNEFIGGF